MRQPGVRSKKSRWSFLLTTVVGTSMMCRVPAHAQPLTKLRIASAPNDDLIGVLWGLETGAFRKAGLDVEVQKANSGAAVSAAVAGGAIELGKASIISLLAGRAKGIPFVLVAPAGMFTVAYPMTAGMIGAKDSTIKTGADCSGKVVGVAGLNDLTALATMAWVDKNGGDARSLKFLEVPGSSIGEAIASGRIDLGTLANPSFGSALSSGKVRLVAPVLTAVGSTFLIAGYFAHAEYVERNRATLTRFRAVVNEMSAYANAHRQQMLAITAKFTGVDVSVLTQQTPQFLGTSLEGPLVAPVIDLAIRYKAVPAAFDIKQMIDS
jgi:NitT/TauT family transport system substrate-binding protein